MINREYLDRSLAELQQQLDRHRQFVQSAFEEPALREAGCVWSDCPHKQTLYTTLLDAVRVLEDTRRAFKSKQLEKLRKSFVQLLEKELRERPHARS